MSYSAVICHLIALLKYSVDMGRPLHFKYTAEKKQSLRIIIQLQSEMWSTDDAR